MASRPPRQPAAKRPARSRPATTPVAAAPSAPTPRRRGRPRLEDGPALDRERLVAALLRITEAEGLEALNMRRVAQSLEVSPRLIYHHVRDKDELVDLLADEILGRHLPDVSSPDWEVRLRNIAQASREGWTRYPGVAAAVLSRSTRRTDMPHATAIRGALTQALADAGLSPEFVELAYLQFSIMVMGGLVLWEGTQRDREQAAIDPDRVQKSIDLGLNLLIFGIRRMASGQKVK